MKQSNMRLIKFGSILFTILSLLCLKAAAATSSLQNIASIKQKTPICWQGEYANNRAETIRVDCPIYVPDAELAPVIRAVWYPPLDPAFANEFVADTKEGMIKSNGG